MKESKIILLLFLVLVSCKKEEFTIENLNGNKITALGHAGMGIGNTYPMNSFESVLKCLNLGMDGSELDVQLTKDSVLVAFHDQDLSEKTNLKGLINSLNWSELKDAVYTQTLYLNYSVVSLEDLFSHIQNRQKYKFTFDCKLYNANTDKGQFYESYISALVKLIEKYQLENNVYIESMDKDFLDRLGNRRPDYKLFIYPESFETGLNTALESGLTGITISVHDISAEQIKTAHQNNLLIAVWNVHTESDNIDAINKNPDFIQTDKVENLIKLLK